MTNSNYPTIVSFFTDTWEYKSYAKLLQNNADKFGLSHYVKEEPAGRFWFENTRIKPKFLLKAFHEIKGPMLWIDVDGSLLKEPRLFALPQEFDLMMRRKPPNHSRTWHVGTIFLNYNEKVEEFLNIWVEYLARYPNASDELCLQHMWKDGVMDFLNIAPNIPVEYFEMLSPQNKYPSPSAVICHRESTGKDKKLR